MQSTGRLKILVYTSLFPNSVQPLAGNFVLERIRHLLGFADISVVAPVPYFPAWAGFNDRWLAYARVPHAERIAGLETRHPRYVVLPKFGMTTHGVSMFAGSFRQVWKQLSESDCDLIDAHYVYPDGFAATILAKLAKKPLVVSARGSDINLFSQLKAIRPFLRHVLRRADGLIAVSQNLKDRMTRLGGSTDKIAVVRNGVDNTKFRPQPMPEMRRKLGIPDGRPVVLSVGTLNDNKGFHILIEAVSRLRSSGVDALLLIVGEGPNRPRLERQIQGAGLNGSVRLAGMAPHGELSYWYNAADVFCLASEREGCPNVVLEAMACGKPVVATRVGGIPELVTSPSLGILADRNPEALGAALDTALHRQWDGEAITTHAHQYRWDNVRRQLLDVYSQAIERFQARAQA